MDPTNSESYAALDSNEEKLRFLLSAMRTSIEQSAQPHFKRFWQAREQCIPLFKEGIHPAVRSLLWQQLCDLSKEARVLGDLLGEQAAYAGEQIGLAIDALEKEMGDVQALLDQQAPLTLPLPSKLLERELPTLDPLQRELAICSQWTSQIAALRKELMATEIRMREKNALFKRLTQIGDQAFPRRKALLEELSSAFLKVVDRFVTTYFADENPSAPFFVIKGEIKGLQAFAKQLTLTAKAFRQTRISLGECWDRVNTLEKSRREESRASAEAFTAEIRAAQEEGGEIEKSLGQIKDRLRESSLGKRERASILAHIAEVSEAAQEESRRMREVHLQQSRVRTEPIRKQIGALIEEGKGLNGDELAKRREGLAKEITDAEITSQDRRELEAELSKVADLIVDAEENSFLKTPDDHPEVLSRLEMVLAKKGRRREGVKGRLEELRKEAGGSSLDFELALEVDGQIKEERSRLEQLDQVIEEIRQRLQSLQS